MFDLIIITLLAGGILMFTWHSWYLRRDKPTPKVEPKQEPCGEIKRIVQTLKCLEADRDAKRKVMNAGMHVYLDNKKAIEDLNIKIENTERNLVATIKEIGHDQQD